MPIITNLDSLVTQSINAQYTNAVIKTKYEANSNTNTYTDAEKSKLAGIEAGATADQTAAEIRTLVEAATDSNVFTDADHSKLNGIAAGAQVNVDTNLSYTAATRVLASSTGTSATLPQVTTSADGLMIAADKTKLNGIETNAKDDQIASEVPVTTSGNLTSTNVQLALQELQSDIDNFTTVVEW